MIGSKEKSFIINSYNFELRIVGADSWFVVFLLMADSGHFALGGLNFSFGSSSDYRQCRHGASFALYVVGVCFNRIGTEYRSGILPILRAPKWLSAAMLHPGKIFLVSGGLLVGLPGSND